MAKRSKIEHQISVTLGGALGEHKTVQTLILEYAQDFGWTLVSREKAEERRAGFPTR